MRPMKMSNIFRKSTSEYENLFQKKDPEMILHTFDI